MTVTMLDGWCCIYICAHHLHMGNSHMYICTCNCTHEIRLHHHACTCRHAQNKTVYHVCVLYNKISYANTTSNFCWILGRKGAKRGNDAKQKMVKPKSSSRIGFTNYSCSQCSPGSSMRLLKLWLQIAWEWLHDVAWAFCWGGSRSTKPCVFPCRVAAAGDERYLVCAAVAAAVVSVANCSSYVFCNEWLSLCA